MPLRTPTSTNQSSVQRKFKPFKFKLLQVGLLCALGLSSLSVNAELTLSVDKSMTQAEPVTITHDGTNNRSPIPKKVALPLDVSTNTGEFLERCSNEFKDRHEEFIIPLQPGKDYFYSRSKISEYIQYASIHESEQCELGALKYALKEAQKELETAHQLLNSAIDSDVSFEQVEGLYQNLSVHQVDIFDIYLRLGVLSDDIAALAYARQANLLWSEWAVIPVDYTNFDKHLRTEYATTSMVSAISRVDFYLTTHQDRLAQKPIKKTLMIDQALIYTVQLNERYKKVIDNIDSLSESLAWRDNYKAGIMQEVAPQLEQLKTKVNNDAEFARLVDELVNNSIVWLIEQAEEEQVDTLRQFFKLAQMRYENFDQEQMLESAKAFMLQNVDNKPLSELLVAMDYAQLGDKASSERWLDKVAQNTDLMRNLCSPDAKSKYFATNQKLLSSPQSEWFKNELMARCL